MARPQTPKEYAQTGKRILKAEMQRKGVSYKELAFALQERGHGPSANEANIRNQINRGGFSAAFFVECCLAMGSYVVRLGEPSD
ncbi:MAG: DUF6471 domain-containing protein [Caulobacter sp.]